jgi:Tol biopolymer transport system component
VEFSDPSGVFQSNLALVRLIGMERRAEAEAPDHPYPLLAQVFYGDYPAAVDIMRTYTVTEVFAQPSALISGTVAQGWEDSLAAWLTRTASSAIEVNPQLAAAYFVRGYGAWLGGTASAAAEAADAAGDVPPSAVVTVVPFAEMGIDPAVVETAVADMRQALELSPDVAQAAYYAAALSLLTGEDVALPSAPGPGNTGSVLDTPPAAARTPGASDALTGTLGVTGTAEITGTPSVSSAPSLTGTASLTDAAASGQGRLLYSTAVDGEDRVFLLAFGAANATLVEVLGRARQPSLQPGGVRLAYQSTQSDMLGLGGYDLTADAEVAAGAGLAQDPNAAGRFNFTTNAEDSLPRWNPEGNRLAFSSTRYGDGRSRVYVVWADGVSEAIDLGEGSDPDWNPDGTRLVYRGCDETGAQCGLWTLALAEGGASDRRLLTDNAGDMRPRWSPDGSRVVFMSDGRDGNWDVYSVGVNADFSPGEVVRITFNAASDGLPAVSPDGRELVFVSNRSNQWGIWRVAIESGQARSVVGELGAVTDWLAQGVDWVR